MFSVEFVSAWLVGLQKNSPTAECISLKYLQYVGLHHGSNFFGDDLW